MNTIPLTFDQRQIQCTLIGGSELPAKESECLPITAVLLNRGARHFRPKIFDSLTEFKFKSIISVEQMGDDYELENLARTYPHVKFVVPQEEVTTGDMINIAVNEAETDYVLVMWNNTSLDGRYLPQQLIEKVINDGILCQVPLVLSSGHVVQNLPMEMVPYPAGNSFEVSANVNVHDNTPTLFPFDFLGIYNCAKFKEIGGYDYTIKNSYWQNMDFCFRAWLYGEKIQLASRFKIKYLDNENRDDITKDSSYLRFYLKNVMPLFKIDHVELSRKRFWAYLKRCPHNIFDTLSEFKAGRAWVEENKNKFKTDAKNLVELWGKNK
ncbi:MAG: hypothetical protein MJ196_09400 [Treponemataceae bacterium]|nr:hypothetical protein [Treponemataceae bacterium]